MYMYAGDMTADETLSASASAWNCRHNGTIVLIDCYHSRQLKESGQLAYLRGPACDVLWRHNSAHKDAMFVVTLVLCDTKCASAN